MTDADRLRKGLQGGRGLWCVLQADEQGGVDAEEDAGGEQSQERAAQGRVEGHRSSTQGRGDGRHPLTRGGF